MCCSCLFFFFFFGVRVRVCISGFFVNSRQTYGTQDECACCQASKLYLCFFHPHLG